MYDKDVPPPADLANGLIHARWNSGGAGGTRKTFEAMEPGDSVFVPFEPHVKAMRPNRSRHYKAFIRVCADRGWKYTSQKREEEGVKGVRMWRLS